MRINRTVKTSFIVLFLALWGVLVHHNNVHDTSARGVLPDLQYMLETPILEAQANLKQPSVIQVDSTHVRWTAGTLNSGGHAITVTASSGAVSTSQNDCSSPGFASCNYVYSNSAGSVAITTTRATALAAGNVLMAYVETSGSAITKLSFPLQASGVATGTIPALTNCAGSTSCAAPVQVQGGAIITQFGSSAMTNGTVTITGLTPAYTSTATYGCVATLIAGTSTGTVSPVITKSSTTSIVIAVGGATTQTVGYNCFGY